MELRWAMRVPEAWRLLRISWRPRRMLGAGVISLVICVLLTAYAVAIQRVTRNPDMTALYDHLCIAVYCYQALLWTLVLPGQVSHAMGQEFNLGTWIFQQTTPQPMRKLLIGKMLGGGGDVYVASLVALPFLIAGAVMGSYPISGILTGCLLILILSALISTFGIYMGATAGRGVSAVIVAILFMIMLFSSSSATKAVMKSPGSIWALHPWFVLASPVSARLQDLAFLSFFGVSVPLALFAAVVYILAAVWVFLGAESRIRRAWEAPMSRLPLLPAFALLEFFIIGLTWSASRGTWAHYQTSLYIFNSLNLICLYFSILNQVSSLGEIRPWLYRLKTGRLSLKEIFRGDAPIGLPVAGALVVVIAGAVLLGLANLPEGFQYSVGTNLSFSPVTIVLIQAGMIAVIALRDAMFFQIAQLRFKSGRMIALIVYLIAFLALPGLFMIKEPKNPYLDLSPASALISPRILSSFDSMSTLLISYLAINGALLIVFVAIVWRLLSNAQHHLPHDLLKSE